MDVPRYPRLNPAFMRFYAPFAALFGRIDTRHRSAQYMQGLLMKRTVRIWLRGAALRHRAFRRLLHDSPWEHHQCAARRRRGI